MVLVISRVRDEEFVGWMVGGFDCKRPGWGTAWEKMLMFSSSNCRRLWRGRYLWALDGAIGEEVAFILPVCELWTIKEPGLHVDSGVIGIDGMSYEWYAKLWTPPFSTPR